jgi:hypothetical protein
MTTRPTSLVQAARRLAASLHRETGLARTGAIADLVDAAEAKRIAFAEFSQVCAARGATGHATAAERDAIRRLLFAADENALILDAVRVTLDDMASKLRAALRSVADPGTYAPLQQRARHATRHVLAARVDASA